MRVGSVEYAVIAFPGNQFNGEVVPALKELVDNGIVNIIDLAFVMKGEDGSATAVELTELPRAIEGAFEDRTTRYRACSTRRTSSMWLMASNPTVQRA